MFYIITPHFFAQTTKSELKANWQFRQSGKSAWYKASVPGTVHNDLLQNKLIEDPFYADNEAKLQWIENEGWEYKGSFTLDSTVLKHKHICLQFDGIDTYAKIYLNDSLILTTENMFRTWQKEIKACLKKGENRLLLLFDSPVKRGKEEAAKIPYVLPEGERVFSRKAQYQFGWDFGPRLPGCGIWKPISICAWDEVLLKSVHYNIKTLTKEKAIVDIIYETECTKAGNYNFKYSLSEDESKKFITANKSKNLSTGINYDTLSCEVQNPKLWWSNGLGKAQLYNLSCTLSNGGKVQQNEKLDIGLRTVELINTRDPAGASFYFKLNGVPVFIKGANYIPTGIAGLHAGTNDDQYYINQAVKANMNMLRVWGGGVYPSDEFYKACDKNGILVWQDFMFACAMYPGDKEFTENVKAEIKEQIIRIRNHPSLALWCGNNESDEGWKNWGWQKQWKYSAGDSIKIWNDYQRLFHKEIPEQINTLNPQTAYWPSSPSIGWGRKESLTSGDSHYWGVWWGMEPFEIYKKKVGRFMSEYGFQGMPDVNTFKLFCAEKDLTLNSVAVKAHQKHKTGFETIDTYMARDYKVPADFRTYVYVSQLLQRDGMKAAIESHRSAKMYCMGTLFWQLNDCWPGISWSAIDFNKTPKATYYSTRKKFQKFMLAVNEQNGVLQITSVSDSINECDVELNIRLMNFKGKILWEQSATKHLSNTEVKVQFINKKEIQGLDSSSTFLHCEIKSGKSLLAETNYFFTRPENLALPKADIKISPAEGGYTISSAVFAKDVYLYSETENLILSDNYFDLLPGINKFIKNENTATTKSKLDIKYITLNNL